MYADYKYGDEFTIKMIALENSGYKTLNELERNTISVYNAFSKGYNKTRGNKGRVIQHNNFPRQGHTKKCVPAFFTHTIMRQKNPTVSDNIFSADKTKK